jgi:hypothetical protein
VRASLAPERVVGAGDDTLFRFFFGVCGGLRSLAWSQACSVAVDLSPPLFHVEFVRLFIGFLSEGFLG